MFCPKCGNTLPDNAAFCNKCGAQLGDRIQKTDTSEEQQSAGTKPPLKVPSVSIPSVLDSPSGGMNIFAIGGSVLAVIGLFMSWIHIPILAKYGVAQEQLAFLDQFGLSFKPDYSLLDFGNLWGSLNRLSPNGNAGNEHIALIAVWAVMLLLLIASIALSVIKGPSNKIIIPALAVVAFLSAVWIIGLGYLNSLALKAIAEGGDSSPLAFLNLGELTSEAMGGALLQPAIGAFVTLIGSLVALVTSLRDPGARAAAIKVGAGIAALALVVWLASSLFSCAGGMVGGGLKPEEIVGTWHTTAEFEDESKHSVSITFKENNDCLLIEKTYDAFWGWTTANKIDGTWSISGNDIKIDDQFTFHVQKADGEVYLVDETSPEIKLVK